MPSNASTSSTLRLQGKKIAALFTDGVEQVEFTEPKQALEAAGAQVTVVSLKPGQVKAWNSKEWGAQIPVDQTLDQAKPDDFDALLLPGGVMNPDTLRMNPAAVQFAKRLFESRKPIAAICHGPWLLVEAGVVQGRTLTSYPSLKTDIRNAGGNWVDREVVVDQGLVTSRNPNDIPAFNQKMVEEFAEGPYSARMPLGQQADEAMTPGP
jgi:protease I